MSIDKRSNRRCREERGNIFIYIKKDDNVDNDCGRRKNDNKKKRASIIKKISKLNVSEERREFLCEKEKS